MLKIEILLEMKLLLTGISNMQQLVSDVVVNTGLGYT